MLQKDLPENLIPYLCGQFERARPILFTGAGISVNAKNICGEPVPSYSDLKKKLWELCFPATPFDESSSLQDIYDHAVRRHRAKVVELLTKHLTINADSLPVWHKTLFSMPWARCYTLNADDLAVAVSRRFKLPRNIVPISATAPATSAGVYTVPSQGLQVIHLNGTIGDLPDHVTFSLTQYAERLAQPDPWYVALVAQLCSQPFVFIGTRLDEPSLWQHLELRKSRGGRALRELRPRSFLVVPKIDLARQALLADYNVEWISMTAEDFVTQVLGEVGTAAQKGLNLLTSRSDGSKQERGQLQEVATLAVHPDEPSDFLLGQEPIWADIQSGRAIQRESDNALWEAVQDFLKKSDLRGLITITGTAGSGKSAALMRVCLRLMAEGIRVGWVDRDEGLAPRDIRAAMRSDQPPDVLAIDDADLYGPELAPMIREIVLGGKAPLMIVAIRAGKVEKILNPVRLEDIPRKEIAMPPLADADIIGLLEVLDKGNRLGILKGKSREEQKRIFREQAGRQLLVAMIQATSGRRFEEKVVEELFDLDEDGQLVYSLVAVASAFRFSLTKDEVLTASGDSSNKVLNVVDQLSRRGILTATGVDGSIRARHRMIAEILLKELQSRLLLSSILFGLALVCATRVNPKLNRSARAWRFLRKIINHEFLVRALGVEPARNLYGSIESLLHWDSHYWLQRGSLEVEYGDLALADNFLNQARGLAPDDPLVDNERAYLLFKQAIQNPAGIDAPEMVTEATTLLEDLISIRGKFDPYPYHVLGSQGLAWARRGIVKLEEKKTYLQKLLRRIEEGQRNHPRQEDLKKLHEDLQRELLSLSITH